MGSETPTRVKIKANRAAGVKRQAEAPKRDNVKTGTTTELATQAKAKAEEEKAVEARSTEVPEPSQVLVVNSSRFCCRTSTKS